MVFIGHRDENLVPRMQGTQRFRPPRPPHLPLDQMLRLIKINQGGPASIADGQSVRILYAEDPLSLLLVSTFFNSFELLYIKSKTPSLSAEAGLSNESFPKVD